MEIKLQDDTWVFVVVQNPEKDPQFAGFYDENLGTHYIPAFMEKQEALECFINLPRESGVKYEVQAVIYEDLKKSAFPNQFAIFILSNNGKVLKCINPEKLEP